MYENWILLEFDFLIDKSSSLVDLRNKIWHFSLLLALVWALLAKFSFVFLISMLSFLKVFPCSCCLLVSFFLLNLNVFCAGTSWKNNKRVKMMFPHSLKLKGTKLKVWCRVPKFDVVHVRDDINAKKWRNYVIFCWETS